MRILAFVLSIVMIMCAFVGCTTPSQNPTNSTPVTPSTPNEDIDETPPEPEVKRLDLYFDDRISVNSITGGIVSNAEIKDQVVTSKVTGTDTPDENVIILDKKARIIAVGTGTATLVLDGVEYQVKVSPAPITLAFITGHSLGYGSRGNFTDTALCEAGQVYSTHVLVSSEKWNLDWKKDFTGSTLGYAEADRVINIDGLTGDQKNTLMSKTTPIRVYIESC